MTAAVQSGLASQQIIPPSITLSFEGASALARKVQSAPLMARFEALLGNDNYVWVDLPSNSSDGLGRTAYIKRTPHGISIHVGSQRELSDVRWTAIEGRFFLGPEHLVENDTTFQELSALLDLIERRMRDSSGRPHVAMIFSSGMHHLRVTPWIPNAGGIEVFLTEFCSELCALGFDVTIFARGGMPHPKTGEPLPERELLPSNLEIVYCRDGHPELVRKEDLTESHFGPLVSEVTDRLKARGVSLICSHYFDGLAIGDGVSEALNQNGSMTPHVHVLHSLGALKSARVTDAEAEELGISRRLALEQRLLPKADAIVATSGMLSAQLEQHHGLKVVGTMPPCINTQQWYRREVPADHQLWTLLAQATGLAPSDVQECKLIVEMSRTVPSKRKEDLIAAFAELHPKDRSTLLVLNVNPRFDEPTATKLLTLIDSLPADTRRHIALLRHLDAELMPHLASITSLYVSPSIMEGWGMSVQEWASVGCPVLTTDAVPYATEILLGDDFSRTPARLLERGIRIGRGAATFPQRDADSLYEALSFLVARPELLREMGVDAQKLTIPSFDWRDRTRAFVGTLRSCLGTRWPDAPVIEGPH